MASTHCGCPARSSYRSAAGHADVHRPRPTSVRRPAAGPRDFWRDAGRGWPSSTSRPRTSSAITRTTTWASSPSGTRGPRRPHLLRRTPPAPLPRSPQLLQRLAAEIAAAWNAWPTASPTSSPSQPAVPPPRRPLARQPPTRGHPALIDPAVYYGWAEAELSMLHGCGNIPDTFYDAYQEVHPLAPGWRDRLPLLHLREHLCVPAHFGRLHRRGREDPHDPRALRLTSRLVEVEQVLLLVEGVAVGSGAGGGGAGTGW